MKKWRSSGFTPFEFTMVITIAFNTILSRLTVVILARSPLVFRPDREPILAFEGDTRWALSRLQSRQASPSGQRRGSAGAD